jgi:hypothetical protein
MNRSMRWTAAVLGLVALTTGLTACGDDDDNDEALATYCEKTTEIETLPEPEIDFENASPEEIATGVKAFAKEKLQPLATEIQANAPEELTDDIKILVGAVDQLVETGDFEKTFGDPKVEAASDRVHEHDLGACDWNEVDVTAKDYKFEGIEDELEAGTTSFEFSNEGKESHELVLLRKNEGVSETFDELLDLPEDQARSKVTSVGGTGGDPGDEDYVVAELTAGDYMAICFISTGTTGEDHEGDGPPHFTKGMKHEFTVS